jgi:phosphoglycolate phosphatase
LNIIFDFDGTLFDTRTVDVAAFNRALNDMGYSVLSEDEVLAVVGKPLSAISADFFGNNEQQVYQFIERTLRCELEEIPLNAQMYPCAIELLHKLKLSGHTLAICSNGNKEYLESILSKFNLSDLFTIVWYAHEGISKIRALEIILEELPQDKTVYVGDRAEDLEAAQSHSLPFIGAVYGYGGNELEGVKLMADDVSEILHLIDQLK